MLEIKHLIQAFDCTTAFLEQLFKNPEIEIYLVTDSHPKLLAEKLQITQIKKYFTCLISSHNFGYSKSNIKFWQKLTRHYTIDLNNTIFVDDNPVVLTTATEFGIKNVVAITNNDSSKPNRIIDNFNNVADVSQLSL